jgi:hypothetical protein
MKQMIFLTVLLFLFGQCKTTKNYCPLPVTPADTTTAYGNQTRLMKSGKIPDSVFLMRKLVSLSITGMDCDYRQHDKDGKDITQCWTVGEIPAQIANLVNLEQLELTINNIQQLPVEMKALQKLKLLDLTDNPAVNNIEVVTELKSLEELYLYGCQMTSLPANIGALSNLKKLGLTGNYLNDEEVKRIKSALPNCVIVYAK